MKEEGNTENFSNILIENKSDRRKQWENLPSWEKALTKYERI